MIQTIVAGNISCIHFVKFMNYQMLNQSPQINNNQMSSVAKKRERQQRLIQKNEKQSYFINRRNDQKAYNQRLEKSPSPKDESNRFKYNDQQFEVNYDEGKCQKHEQVQQHKIYNEQFEEQDKHLDDSSNKLIQQQKQQQQFEFQENFESKLQDEIHKTMIKYFGQDELTSVRQVKEILETFKYKLENQKKQVDLANMFECFEECLKLKKRYFANKHNKDRTLQHQQASIEWDYIFQLAFLLILKRKIAEDKYFQRTLQHSFEDHVLNLIKYIDWPFKQMDKSLGQYNESMHKAINRSLKVIQSLCSIKKNMKSQMLIQKIMNPQRIKRLTRLIGRPSMKLQVTVLITHIFLLIVQGRFLEVFQYILKCRYGQGMRNIIAFQIDFNPAQVNEQVIQQEKMVTNFLEFLNQCCQLNDKTFFWDIGVYPKLYDILQRGVLRQSLKIDMTSCIFKTMTFNPTQSFAMRRSNFDWAYDCCTFCITSKQNSESKQINNLLKLSIEVLQLFLRSLDRQYYQNKLINKSSCEMFIKCQEGRELMKLFKLQK